MLLATVFMCGIIILSYSTPLRGIDRTIKLYICQTEHELDRILSWEYSAPDKYRSATKNGALNPLDAARELAGRFVADDNIVCSQDNRVMVETERKGMDKGPNKMKVLDNRELEEYCPQTMKKYGHPCI